MGHHKVHQNTHNRSTKKGIKREKSRENIKKRMAEYLVLLKTICLHIQEAQETQSTINAKRSMPRHSIVNTLKDKVIKIFPYINITGVLMITQESLLIQILILRLVNITYSKIITKFCFLSLSQFNQIFLFFSILKLKLYWLLFISHRKAFQIFFMLLELPDEFCIFSYHFYYTQKVDVIYCINSSVYLIYN